MIKSMTGFANGSAEHGRKRLYIELRAVNHRYLDIQFKMPEDLRHLEGALREAVSAHAASSCATASRPVASKNCG